MNRDPLKRKSAIIVGALIILAYAVLAALFFESVIIIILFEVIAGLAVIGISLIMSPLFKPTNEKTILAYIIGKFVEGILMIVAAIILLSDNSSVPKIRGWIYDVFQLLAFILSAMVFYYLLYQSKLVPRFISIWGLIASTLLLVINILEALGYSHDVFMLLFLQIVLNEFVLAIWLMIKGFNEEAIAPPPIKTEIG